MKRHNEKVGYKSIVAAITLGMSLSWKARADDFEYISTLKSLFIKGWIENQYSFFCGVATRAHITDRGYISLYQHDYWLLGQPHKSWNFEVQTGLSETAFAWADILIDGVFFTRFAQRMRVETHSVSSGSDVCDDHLGGLCPARSNVNILNDLIARLTTAKKLTFVLYDGINTETHEMDSSDWRATQSAIDVCLRNLAILTHR